MVSLFVAAAAAAAGLTLGRAQGGDTDMFRINEPGGWYPTVPLFGAAGVAAQLLAWVLDLDGHFGGIVSIGATTALVWFAWCNVRVGGMVVVFGGLALNDAVMILNGGMPQSGSMDSVRGARVPMTGAALSFLGKSIPGPFGARWSIGDVLIGLGIVLVTMSLSLHRLVTPKGSYASLLTALGRGPMSPRGPEMHPARRAETLLGPRDDDSYVRLLRDDDYF